MTTEWTWDETLFADAARYYDAGRLPYSPELAGAFARSLGLDGAGRLLDVGCGPGSVALRLAGLFEEVVGLDADTGMIEEARRLAQERGVGNARFVLGRAERLPAGLGRFRVVTFAASFHWMDRSLVAGLVRSMLTPGGAVVHVDDRRDMPEVAEPTPHPAPPHAEIEELLRSYLGPERRAGQSIRTTSPSGEEAIFRGAGFEGPDDVVVPDGRILERTTEHIVADTFSRSWAAPHLFGDRQAAFERDLRALLLAASPEGLFSVRRADGMLHIWRPAGG
ncbi:MAG TPA: class I SAM-dependent methyltransferase [Candidatus Dormibacteraeota bacterium]|nr:class I SAM-dependent methyltransferase [Candidatus Dormibacteraeota bacterium]